jgi:hypothetical protein
MMVVEEVDNFLIVDVVHSSRMNDVCVRACVERSSVEETKSNCYGAS